MRKPGGKCPNCELELHVKDFVETITCPRCHEMFHPENLIKIPGVPLPA